MKKLLFKTILITSILGFIFASIYIGFGIMDINALISTVFNIEEGIALNIASFLFMFFFFTFMFSSFALFTELPYYLIKGFKKADNVVAYKYEDSGESIYTRELPKYNAALAGYIVDYTTDARQDYIALYVELIGRGIIKRDYEGNVTGEDITQSTDSLKLKTSELFVISTYKKYSELALTDFLTFKRIIQDEAIKEGFIKDNSQVLDAIEKLRKFYSDRFEKPELFMLYSGYAVFFLMMLLFVFIPIPFNFITVFGLVLLFRYKYSMNKYTKEGKIEKENMAKFRQFMKKQTALSEKDLNDRNFEKFIPYAIAFDVNNIYQQKFEEILKNLK